VEWGSLYKSKLEKGEKEEGDGRKVPDRTFEFSLKSSHKVVIDFEIEFLFEFHSNLFRRISSAASIKF